MIGWPGRAIFLATSILVVFALGVIHGAEVGDYSVTDANRFAWVLVYGALCSLVGYSFGLPDQPLLRVRIRAAAATALVAPLLFAAVQVVSGGNLIPRFVLLTSMPVLFVVDIVVSSALVAVFRRNSGRERVLFIGSEAVRALADEDVQDHLEIPCVIVGGLDPRAADIGARLTTTVAEQRISLIVVSAEALDSDDLLAALAEVHRNGTRVRTVDAFYDQWIGKVPLHELGSAALLFDIREIHHYGYTRTSRALDLVVALLGLPVLVLAIAFVAVGNLFGNRGPLFFGQHRVGKDQRVFTIWKFRTMRPGPTTGEWTTEGDGRITPFGGFLRRTHLDELPQVVNILRGDLSVVGPRPEQPRYVERLSQTIPYYRTRHVVRPGLTGWAQVNFPYGATDGDAYEKLQYELWYLGHQSIALDLQILARTARHVLGSRGR